jgi:hypothetical protein
VGTIARAAQPRQADAGLFIACAANTVAGKSFVD